MSASHGFRAADREVGGVHHVDPEERWPDLTVNDGRRTLGFVYDNDDGTVTATDSFGGLLGNFPKRDGARLAIIANAGKLP